MTEHNAHKTKSPRPFSFYEPTQRWLHPRCPSWSLLCILPWFEAQLPIGFEYEPRGFGHFGLIFDQNLPSFENRVLVRIELRDFYNLVFYFILFRLVSMRATLPLCTRAHTQALMTRVGGDNLTIGCMFESTYYGPTPKVFTHIFALKVPKICSCQYRRYMHFFP